MRGATPLAAVLSLALLTSACGPERTRWQPQEPLPQQRSFAVVWVGATFYVAPDQRAPTVALSPPGAERAPWLRDTFVAVHVLRERGAWAQVETLGEPASAHCVAQRPALRPLRLRLYVARNALAAVTVREVTQGFEDGTSIRLGRGVPLERLNRPGFYRARLDELSTVVRLDPTDVGQRYLPSSEPAGPAAPEGWLSADALRAGAPVIGQTGRVHSSADTRGLPVYGVQPRGSETIADLRPRCAQLRVRVPSHVIGDSLAVTPNEAPAAVSPPYAEPGAALFWPGGREAGSVSERVGLDHEVEGDAEHRCFGRALHVAAEPSVVLCVRREDVVQPGAVAAGLTTPGE